MHIFQKRNYSRKERLESPPFFSFKLHIHIMNPKFCIKWETKNQGLDKEDPQWLWSLRTSPGLSIFTWERRMPPTKSLQPRAHQGWVWSLPWQTLLFYRPQTHSASCPSTAWVSSLHRFCEQPSTFQIVLFCLNWWELVSAPCRQRPLTDIPMLTCEDTEARNDSINWQMLHNWLVEQQRKDA